MCEIKICFDVSAPNSGRTRQVIQPSDCTCEPVVCDHKKRECEVTTFTDQSIVKMSSFKWLLLNGLMITHYYIQQKEKIVGPFSLAQVWRYHFWINFGFWIVLGITFLQKEIGSRINLNILSYSFRFFSYIYQFSLLWMIPM